MIEIKNSGQLYIFCGLDIKYIKTSQKGTDYAIFIKMTDEYEILVYRNKKDYENGLEILKKGLESIWNKN